MRKDFLDNLPFSIAFESDFHKLGYGFFESKHVKIALNATTIDSYIILYESKLISVHCEFQYFIDWLKKKNTSKPKLALIKAIYLKASRLELTPPFNLLHRLALRNINFNGFKNYIFRNQLFGVCDKELKCYQNYVDCRKVIDNPAPAIGNSKLVYSYKGEVFHERILELY